MNIYIYNVIKAAVKIRVRRGEKIDDVLASYTKLTDKERAQIKKELEEE